MSNEDALLDPAELVWLRRFFLQALAIGLVSLALALGMAIWQSGWRILVTIGFPIIFCLSLLVALRALRSGRARAASALIAAIQYVTGLIMAVTIPEFLPALLLLPILGALIALPYQPTRHIPLLLVVSSATTLAILALTALAPPSGLGWPLPLAIWVTAGAAAFLVLMQVRQYYRRIERLRSQADATQARLEAEIRERTVLTVEREARYRAISDMTSDYTFSLTLHDDGTTSTDWINEDAFERITGYSAAEMDARGGFRTIVAPEDVPVMERRAERVLANNIDVSELRIIHKSGETRWLRAYTRPVWSREDRRVIRILGAMQDVTERKRAELALRESEERYRSLIELAPLGILIIRGGEPLYANPAYLRLFGYASATEIEDCPLLTPPDGGLPEHGAARRIEVTGTRSNSERFPLSVDLAQIPMANDHATIAFFTDMTEQRRAEEQRLAFERRLAESQKRESIGLLAGGIAHDFNNVLAAIIGNTTLAISDTPADSPTRESLDEILKSARRAADLTRQLLAYAGKGRLLIERIDLAALLDGMAHLVASAIAKSIMLEYELAPDVPPIEGDATQIRQVVMNLILNAAEALGDASGRITLRTTLIAGDALAGAKLDHAPETLSGRYVALEVEDDGPGMDEETRARIFDPFFSTKFAGRGLGMAAVLGIVQSHAGALDVASAPGSGTRVRVLLPALEPPPAAPPVETPAAPRPAGDRRTVLVVDDEEALLRIIGRVLERGGYQTLLARDGEEGLALLREHGRRIDCVLCDLTMPRMDGAATIAEIRRTFPTIPIIAMSGYSEEEAAEKVARQAVSGFVQKPFPPSALLASIEQALER